jgi:hypothetical protein
MVLARRKSIAGHPDILDALSNLPNPSVRMYKDKFSQWKWSKHLPIATAQWLVGKTEQRRLEGKETVVHYGGQIWTEERVDRSLTRAKARGIGTDLESE